MASTTKTFLRRAVVAPIQKSFMWKDLFQRAPPALAPVPNDREAQARVGKFSGADNQANSWPVPAPQRVGENSPFGMCGFCKNTPPFFFPSLR